MYYGMQGLGADGGYDPTKSTISWWCWEQKGFKDCHGKQWEQARAFCQQTNSEGYTSMDVCINKEADTRAKLNCSCPTSAPAKASSAGNVQTGTYVLGFAFLALVGMAIWKSRKD
jgi:hypothetical protein